MAEISEDKKKLGIIVALIAGLLALGMMFVFLKNIKETASDKQVSTTIPTTQILVVVNDLPVGHKLDVNKDLKKISVPINSEVMSFIEKCVPAIDAQLFDGRTLASAIASDNPLLYSNLAESFNFDEKFQDGFLKTIILSKENLFGSRLIPGDRVDILVTMPKPTKAATNITPKEADKLTKDPAALVAKLLSPLQAIQEGQDLQTITVLENVEVFMIGSLIEFDRIQLGYKTQSEVENSNEITFRLDKNDAVTLTQYYNSPKTIISLLLRPRSN